MRTCREVYTYVQGDGINRIGSATTLSNVTREIERVDSFVDSSDS